jgi:hypothetical protein
MPTIPRHIHILFNLGLAGLVFSGQMLWPQAVPWGIAFWAGYMAGTFSLWIQRY